jgi:CRISPR-associated protein Csd1
MILQALKEYYDRKAADPESGIAPEGWEWKEIPFVIVLDRDGKLMRIEDTREGEGKKKRAKAFLVPMGEKKTSGIKANLLWEVPAYIFGTANTKGLDPEKATRARARAKEQHKAFMERIESDLHDTDRLRAVLAFLSSITKKRLEEETPWEEIFESSALLSIRFNGEKRLYCESDEVRRAIDKSRSSKQANGTCLISGETDAIAQVHTAIKRVYGAQPTGANIVSFNLDAFRSFNKKQGDNAPIGERSMFAYTTALNTLLGKDSQQRMQIGDASSMFWSAQRTRFESDFAFFFKEPQKDDPDSGDKRIKNLFDSAKTGAYIDDRGDEKFYVLGLSPNAGRASVRFWQAGTVADFADRIRRHFEDLRIVKPPNEPEYYSIWRILVNISVQDKSENIPPNVAGDFMRSILDGAPYPQTLLQAALRRIHSDTEHRVKPVRAAMLKAYINRYHRAHPKRGEKEIEMALDKEQSSIGYQLGRLFAGLEKIQEEGNPGINATIRERYYGAACSSPVTVFGTLMRLKNHHLAKIENKGRVVNLERLVGEIVGRFGDFPPHLDLHEQGRFAIGYYHQRQDFFSKKSD